MNASPSIRRQFRLRAPYLVLAYGMSVFGALAPGVSHAQDQAATQALPAPAPVQDQDTAGPPPIAAGDKIETVTVTARKVKEALQDVPMAITAFNARALENSGVRTVQDLSNLTPGLTLSAAGTSSNVPTIRGQASISAFTDSNVAIFLDGIYLNNSSAVSLGLIDLERIEVVKGPVSALYGRNAYAGAINYVSKAPPKELSGSVAVTYGSAGMKNTTMNLGGTVIPGLLRVRAALGYEDYDGTHTDGVNGLRTGGDKQKDGQVAFILTPNDKMEVSGALYRGVDFYQNSAIVYMDNNCGPVSNGKYTQNCGELNTRQHPVEISATPASSGAAGNQRYVTSANLKGTYDLGFADVTTLFGYNKVDQTRFVDFNGRRDGLAFPLTTGGTVTLPVLFGSLNNNKDWSGELRLASKQNQRLRWSTGAYYFDATRLTANLTSVDASTLPSGDTVKYLADFAKYQSANGSFNIANETPAINTDRLHSEFVGTEFDIVPTVTAAAEIRHTSQDKTQLTQLYNAATGTFVQNSTPLQTATYAFNNYRTTLNWKPRPGEIYYGSLADGTKAGGFNTLATLASEASFKPETNTTLEFGSKNTFLDGKLQLNAAVFRIKAKSLQVVGPSDDPANNAVVTKNYGAATTNGFELETIAKPLHGLTINAGIGYTDPTFDAGTYDYSAGYIATCKLIASCAQRVVTVASAQGQRQAVSLADYQLPRASKVSLTLGALYTKNVADDWYWSSRIDVNFRSKQFSTQQDLNWWGSQKNVNLRTWIENDHYRVDFFVKNATDNQVPGLTLVNTRLNDLVTEMIGYLPEDRTYGITASYKF